MNHLAPWQDQPLQTTYHLAAGEQEFLQQNSGICIVEPMARIQLGNSYYPTYRGSHAEMYTRQAVRLRILKALALLPSQYGFYLFDIFRTLETQQHLFETFYQIIQQAHPTHTHEQLVVATKRYVSLPYDLNRQGPPPHNTGGAVDLAIYNVEDGELLDFGCPFDTTEPISSTAFFEQAFQLLPGFDEARWHTVQRNRRLLCHVMLAVGFTNYTEEWWHFDLGDCMWASQMNTAMVYSSMEEVLIADIAY